MKKLLNHLLALLMLCGACAAWAQTAPAQAPLISRDAGGVKPNLVLTFDESGSMTYQYMPEKTNRVGSWTVNFPDDDGLIMHPADPRQFSGTFHGTIPARVTGTTVLERQMRSPDVNLIYYNPEVRYQPWLNADGTRLPNATITNVKFDPVGLATTATTTLALTSQTVNIGSTLGLEWCTSVSTSFATTCSTGTLRYVPAIYYRLGTNPDGSYKNPNLTASFTAVYINTATTATFTKYPGRTDCAANPCTRAEEQRNYANWFQYYRSRLLLAQASVQESFQSLDDRLRVGWGRIHKGYTSVDSVSTAIVETGVRDFTGTHKVSMFNWIRDQDVFSGTPLRQAIYGVGEYYQRSDNRGPWGDMPGNALSGAHKSCRRAYNLLITDGYWSDTGAPLTLPALGNVDNTNGSVITGPGRTYQYLRERPYRDDQSNTLADVAMYFWNRDLRSTLDNKVQPTAENPAFWQHMVNFTVGLGVTGLLNPETALPSLTSGSLSWTTDKIDDLWHAAVNSRGSFFSAKNSTDLSVAIRSALTQTTERELREAGVATAATVLEAGNRKYIPRYRTGAWIGDVEAYVLDANGQAGALAWSAAARMPTWSARNIVTWDAGLTTPAAVTFTWASMTAANRTALGAGASSTLVDFLRGDRSREGTDPGDYRVRDSILGDFINSNPVFARNGLNEGYSSLPSIGASYPQFLTDKGNRMGVLYIGGNDGMVHGFKETRGTVPSEDGREVFAYVPRTVYSSLSVLASPSYGTTDNYHRFYVDGPLREADAHVRAPGATSPSWRNYLVGTFGAGGRGLFALDVTDPTQLGPRTVRWEINSDNDSDIGYITAPVVVGTLPNGRWVAIFGNGYIDSAFSRAYLFVVDLESGAISKLGVAPLSLGNGLGGVAVRKNSQGQIVNLYAGDAKGRLWKFDYDDSAASDFKVANAGSAIFQAEDSLGNLQPIVQPPILFPHSLGGNLILIGTGRLMTTDDANSAAIQSLYGVWEKPSDSLGPPYSRSQLDARTISQFTGANGAVFFDINGGTTNWTTSRGWYIDLNISGFSGLRTIYPPQGVNEDLVLFSTVAPAQNLVPCEQATGQGVNFIFPAETGKSADYCLFDTNGDGLFNSSDVCDAAAYSTGADGIDAVLSSPTTDCTGATCLTKFSIQNTTGQIMIQASRPKPASPSPATANDRLWRRIINPPIR